MTCRVPRGAVLTTPPAWPAVWFVAELISFPPVLGLHTRARASGMIRTPRAELELRLIFKRI